MTDASSKPPGRRIVLGLGLLVILGALVLAYVVIKKDRTEGSTNVRIGYLPIEVDLPLFVALEKGYFEKRGVTVEPIRFESSPLMGTALVNKEVDAIASIASSVAFSIESRDSGRFRIFIVDAENPNQYLSALVTMPKSQITRVIDLRGKKVGIFPGPTASTFFNLVFRKHGLDPKADMTVIELAQGLHVQALVNGQVDALATYEPIATRAVVEHGAVKFLPGAVESEIINPWQAGVWLLSSRLIEDRPEIAKKVVEACYEAIDFIRAHPDDAKQALNKFTGIRPEVAAKIPGVPFTKIGEVDLEALQRHAEILQEAGVLSRRIDTRSLLLDSEFVKARSSKP
jgi:NitT/TauT family transport system substrate-binding protein